MTEENKLTNSIMEYWETCIFGETASVDKDFKVNDLIYKYASSLGIKQEKLEADVTLTVRNMTNSQKRELLKMLIKSGIR